MATTTTPVEHLLDLHRQGRTAECFPALGPLLEAMSPAERVRAGRLLARTDPGDVRRAHPSTPAVSVAVTGHGTLPDLVAALTGEFARHGLLIEPTTTGYDSWVLELSDPAGTLRSAGADLVLCLLDAAVVFDEVPAVWGPQDVQAVLEEKLRLIDGLCRQHAAAARGTLVLNTMPLPRHHPAQLVDLTARAVLGALWREANARLLRLAEHHPSVVVLDLDTLVTDGLAAHDSRMSRYAGAHLPAPLLAAYARQIGHLARAVTGRTRKALVLDLDETLWGGVLGEAGADGIEIGEGYRGRAFAAFQTALGQLGAQGVLLAVASKNDPEPVRRVLREHPGMVLREADFVRVVANWRPKPENLAALAAELNLGVDALVFVDDSPSECGMVRSGLPDVAVVQVGDDPAEHLDRLLADGWFDVRRLTEADRARPAQYRDELARSDFQQSFDSVEEYLRGLGVRVRLAPAGPADVARVSQLTLRTNQFNLTTRRLQQADVQDLVDSPAGFAVAVRTADRFGDNGLVGAVLGHWETGTLHLDNVLLSCRVFGRGVESAMLAAVLRHARAAGAATVTGEYRPSAKNTKFAGYYAAHGFQPAGGGAQAGTVRYRHELTGLPAVPGHIDLIDELAIPTGAK